jgi:uncharacterized membrane protein
VRDQGQEAIAARRLVIGLFLTPQERLELAHALQRALHRYR